MPKKTKSENPLVDKLLTVIEYIFCLAIGAALAYALINWAAS